MDYLAYFRSAPTICIHSNPNYDAGYKFALTTSIYRVEQAGIGKRSVHPINAADTHHTARAHREKPSDST